VFDETNGEWAGVREALHQLLDAEAWRAARRTTINAHYTNPAIAQAMWQTLTDLGFNGGRVLEPGAGGGTFIGLAPAAAELTGVELDPTTARIAQQVHPHATIRAESFAQTPLPDGYFDAAIGNVPFADVRLHDPRHNPSRLSLHNHFIVKALSLVREGGLVAVLTSHYTMDAHNPAARRAIHRLGELLGAVRLPTGAHRRTAGTDALTDLLFLRRRDPDGDPDPAGWETTRAVDVDVDGSRARINPLLRRSPRAGTRRPLTRQRHVRPADLARPSRGRPGRPPRPARCPTRRDHHPRARPRPHTDTPPRRHPRSGRAASPDRSRGL
jgi:hypothetical protein